MKGYVIDYINENEFKKLERALKKCDMLAYKKLNFEYYPSLRNGKFLGELIEANKKAGTEKYELHLPATDKIFTEVHGDIKLIYTVYTREQTIMLNTITPTELLLEGHKSELTTYKGIMISKVNASKDMFKIDLLKQLQNNGSSTRSYHYQYNFNTQTNDKPPRELQKNFVSSKTKFKQPDVDIEVICKTLKWYIDTNDETSTKIESSKINKKDFVKTLNIAQDMFVQKEYIVNNILYNFSKKDVTKLLNSLVKDKLIIYQTTNNKKYYQINNKNILILNKLLNLVTKKVKKSNKKTIEEGSKTYQKPPLFEYIKAISSTQFNILSLNNRKKDLDCQIKKLLRTNIQDFLTDNKTELNKIEKLIKQRELINKKLNAIQNPEKIIYNVEKPIKPIFNLTKPPMPTLKPFNWFTKLWIEDENQELIDEYNKQVEYYNRHLNIYLKKLDTFNKEIEEYNTKINALREIDRKIYNTERTKYANEILKIDEQIRNISKNIEINKAEKIEDVIEKNQKNSIFFGSLKLIEQEIDYVEDEIEKNEELRDNLYKLGIIYPKYQTLSAISSFLEYLDSGRCKCLEGENGGYNIYEKEIDSKSINKHYYLNAKIKELQTILTNIEKTSLIKNDNVNKKTNLSSKKIDLSDNNKFNQEVTKYYEGIKDSYNEALNLYVNTQK